MYQHKQQNVLNGIHVGTIARVFFSFAETNFDSLSPRDSTGRDLEGMFDDGWVDGQFYGNRYYEDMEEM